MIAFEIVQAYPFSTFYLPSSRQIVTDPTALANAMGLVDLPPETLTHIVQDLGRRFFTQDLRRLTICKQWHAIAQEEFHARVTLNTKKIDQLHQKMKNTNGDSSSHLPGWAKKIQTLQITFSSKTCNDDSRKSSHEILHRLDGYDSDGARKGSVFKPLEQLERLRSLNCMVQVQHTRPWIIPNFSHCAYAGFKISRELAELNLPSLCSLDLNIGGCYAFAGFDAAGKDHACKMINRFLNRMLNLKSCRLRLARICPTIVAERPADGSMALELLCIQCDISAKGTFCSSKECQDSQSWPPNPVGPNGESKVEMLAENLTKAVKAFQPALKAPKKVRVVWPDILSEMAWNERRCKKDEVRRFARDCLSTDVLTFPKSQPWHAAGQVIRAEDLKAEFTKYRPGNSDDSDTSDDSDLSDISDGQMNEDGELDSEDGSSVIKISDEEDDDGDSDSGDDDSEDEGSWGTVSSE